MTETLKPIFPVLRTPTWTGARWISSIDPRSLDLSSDYIYLEHSTGFTTARILIRNGMVAVGNIEIPIHDGKILTSDLLNEISTLPQNDYQPEETPPVLPYITVAVPTRDRCKQLKTAIDSLLNIDYPHYEILIIDNVPKNNDVSKLVESYNNKDIRCVVEPIPGSSAARNRALIEARGKIVAFADDDVVADPSWLYAITQAFSLHPNVHLVSGSVRSGEIFTPAQDYFERRVHWEGGVEPRVFTLAESPKDIELFPFELRYFGTGANFAVDREAVIRLGGFNEALGAGVPTGGGEDIELFVRVLYGGGSLVTQPAALIWHKHRESIEELSKQMHSYGKGMGAWVFTVLADKEMRLDALHAMNRALKRYRNLGKAHSSEESELDPDHLIPESSLRRKEIYGILIGPCTYLYSRFRGASKRPLHNRI